MNRKAFVLSIVLWIVAALLFGIATLALLSKDTQFLTKGIDSKLKTQLTAEDILENIKFYILTADFDNNSYINNSLESGKYKFPNRLIVDNRWYSINKDIKIRLQDTSALINVFYPNKNLISYMATSSSQRQERFVIADSIKDWSDSDNIVSLNGAEASRYELKEGLNYTIRNSPALQSIEELRLINGLDSIDEKEWNSLKKKFYYGRGCSVNLSIIDTKYLSYLLKINSDMAENLVNIRETNIAEFIKKVIKEKNFDDELMGFHLSKQIEIEIEVKEKNARTILKTLINFKRTDKKLYEIIYYKNI